MARWVEDWHNHRAGPGARYELRYERTEGVLGPDEDAAAWLLGERRGLIAEGATCEGLFGLGCSELRIRVAVEAVVDLGAALPRELEVPPNRTAGFYGAGNLVYQLTGVRQLEHVDTGELARKRQEEGQFERSLEGPNLGGAPGSGGSNLPALLGNVQPVIMLVALAVIAWAGARVFGG